MHIVSFLKSTNGIITIIFSIVMLIFFWSYSISFKSAIRKRKKIINKLLSDISDGLETAESKQTFVNIHFNDTDLIQGFPKLILVWRQYRRHIIEIRRKEYATVDAEEYFNIENLISDLSVGWWNNLSSVFTGLGILGTFVGLCVGMFDLDLSTMEGTMSSIGSLLDGTKTAFITSIIGIVFSLIFSVKHSSVMKGFTDILGNLTVKLDETFPLQTREKLIASLLAESERQTRNMREMNEGMQDDIKETLEAMEEKIQLAVEEALKSSMVESFKPVFEEIDTTLKGFREDGKEAIAKEIKKSAGKAIEKFAKSVDKARMETNGALEESTKAMVAAKDALSDMARRTAEINGKTETLVAAVNEKTTAMVNVMDESTGKLLSSMENTVQAFRKTSEPVTAALSSMSEMGNNMNTLSSSMSESVQTMAQSSSLIKSALEQNAAYQKDTADRFNRLAANMEASSQSLYKGANGILNSTQAAFHANIKEYDQSIGSVLETLRSITTMLNETGEELASVKKQKGSTGQNGDIFNPPPMGRR